MSHNPFDVYVRRMTSDALTSENIPPIPILAANRARTQWSTVVDRAKSGDVTVISRHGHPRLWVLPIHRLGVVDMVTDATQRDALQQVTSNGLRVDVGLRSAIDGALAKNQVTIVTLSSVPVVVLAGFHHAPQFVAGLDSARTVEVDRLALDRR